MTARRGDLVVVPAVAAVVAVLLAALAAGAAMRHSDALDHRVGGNGTRALVLSAATEQVATVLSYDYRHLDDDFARAEALLTPKFRKSYVATTDRAVRDAAERYKAISQASVTGAGLVSGSPERAVVLVFVQQTATNTQLDQPRLDQSRLRVTLVRSGERWLIDDISPL